MYKYQDTSDRFHRNSSLTKQSSLEIERYSADRRHGCFVSHSEDQHIRDGVQIIHSI